MKTNTKFAVGIAPIAVLVLGLVFFRACTPSYEEGMTLDAINQHKRILERGGHVEEVQFIRDKQARIDFINGVKHMDRASKEDRIRMIEEGKVPKNDAPFQGEVLDADGNVVGEVMGFRVEGFGTVITHCELSKVEEEQNP